MIISETFLMRDIWIHALAGNASVGVHYTHMFDKFHIKLIKTVIYYSMFFVISMLQFELNHFKIKWMKLTWGPDIITPSRCCRFRLLDLRLSTLLRKALAPSLSLSLPERLNLAAKSSLSVVNAPGGKLPYRITTWSALGDACCWLAKTMSKGWNK